jgi:predicted lipoprotein with Yx(FWY)xxD motif
MIMKRVVIAAAILALAGLAQANPTVEKDGVLANKEGRTLYVFDKDAAGKSACNGGCAAAWPPFAVANAALAGGDFTIIAREDGGQQWAYRGKPLYLYAGDSKPGERNGDGQGGVWHAASTGKSTPPANARVPSAY